MLLLLTCDLAKEIYSIHDHLLTSCSGILEMWRWKQSFKTPFSKYFLFLQDTRSEFTSKSFFLRSIMGSSKTDIWLFDGFKWSQRCNAYYLKQGMVRILFESTDISHTNWSEGYFACYFFIHVAHRANIFQQKMNPW